MVRRNRSQIRIHPSNATGVSSYDAHWRQTLWGERTLRSARNCERAGKDNRNAEGGTRTAAHVALFRSASASRNPPESPVFHRRCKPKGYEFETCLWSQTNLHCEFFALLVDASARTDAKMANSRGNSLSRYGARNGLTPPGRRACAISS